MVAFLRAEARFAGLEALKAQIAADCDAAREALNRTPV
jgi:FAD synthase